MKALELNPMAMALSESNASVSNVSNASVSNVKNAVKKHLAAVVKFLMFISPVYPMVAQGMKEA